MATLKQKRLAKELLENKGMAVSKAMLRAGYSKKTAKNPQQVTKSKNWQELMEEYLPDQLLAEKHEELLTVPRIKRRYVKGDLEEETEEIDTNAVKYGLDMAYKLKGKYSPEKIDTDPYGKMDNDELWKEIQRLRRELKIKDL